MNFLYRLTLPWAKKLRQQNYDFRVKNTVDSIRGSCILEIQLLARPLVLAIKELEFRLGVKGIQQRRVLTCRESGKETVLPHPLFAEWEVVWLRVKHYLNLFSMAVFLLAETALYQVSASLFAPGAAPFLRIIIAVFLATIITFALDHSFSKVFDYRQAVTMHARKEISDTELKVAKDLRNIAYGIIVLCLAAIITGGLARLKFLEHIDSRGLSPQKYQSLLQANAYGSYFTLFITILSAVFMALLKKDQSKIGVKYRVFLYWRRCHIRANKCYRQLIKNATLLPALVENSVQKHFSLVVDTRRVLTAEYDPRYESQNKEYLKQKTKNGFSVTPDIYTNYEAIQSGHEELFKFGIYNDKSVRDKLALANEVLSMPKEYLFEHLGKAPKQPPVPERMPSTNGKIKDYEFKIN